MMKMSDKTLEELYSLRPTPSVLKAIIPKEDFHKISENWCTNICTLTCSKRFKSISLDLSPVDIVIIQSHNAIDERFKTGLQIEATYREIISYLARKYFRTKEGRPLTYKVLNLLKCTPEGRDIKTASKPVTDTQLVKCSPYLSKEIEISNPKAIISLTTSVSKALGLKNRRGKPVNNKDQRGEIYGNVVISQHPKITTMIRQNASGAMWGSTYFEILERDFEKAAKIASGELVVPPLDASISEVIKRNQIAICRSLNEVSYWTRTLRGLPGNSIISFDIETSGLDPWADDAKILTIQFGFRRPDGCVQSVVIPLWHRDNTCYVPNLAWEMVKPVLENENILKVGHGLSFDVCYIAATTSVRVSGIIFDTLLLLHAMNSGLQLNYGLKRALHDFLPESGLGGYEDNLPELTKAKKKEGDEDESDEDEDEE